MWREKIRETTLVMQVVALIIIYDYVQMKKKQSWFWISLLKGHLSWETTFGSSQELSLKTGLSVLWKKKILLVIHLIWFFNYLDMSRRCRGNGKLRSSLIWRSGLIWVCTFCPIFRAFILYHIFACSKLPEITFSEQEAWKGKCVLSKALDSLYVDYCDVNMKQSYKVCFIFESRHEKTCLRGFATR